MKVDILTCSPILCLATRCSWKGHVAERWYFDTELTWVVDPIWACSHTIATNRKTFDFWPYNIYHHCRAGEVCVCCYHFYPDTGHQCLLLFILLRDKSLGNSVNSKACAATCTNQSNRTECHSLGRWGWWVSSWCRPEWCHRSSPWVECSCCSPSWGPQKVPLRGSLLLLQTNHTQVRARKHETLKIVLSVMRSTPQPVKTVVFDKRRIMLWRSKV